MQGPWDWGLLMLPAPHPQDEDKTGLLDSSAASVSGWGSDEEKAGCPGNQEAKVGVGPQVGMWLPAGLPSLPPPPAVCPLRGAHAPGHPHHRVLPGLHFQHCLLPAPLGPKPGSCP